MIVFVFGSNERGIHGAGAALDARKFWGAKWGQGSGLQGEAFAIPTCSKPGVALSLPEINFYTKQFISFAKDHPEIDFQVTRIGCGYAGYTDEEIGPLFDWGPPVNVHLPLGWRERFVT